MRLTTAVCVLVCALPTAAQRSEQRAHDGRRGLGGETELSDLLQLFHSSKEPDRQFLGDLAGLATEVELIAASSLERYRARGYLALLPATEHSTLTSLHALYAESAADPLETLVAGDARARTLARMLADTRFRARAAVLGDFELEVHELVGGLAVLRGATDGYVQLNQAEASNIANRVDLSASLLRAMRNDLLALREAKDTSDDAVDARGARLFELAKASEGENVRRAAVQRECQELARLEQSMASALFTTRTRSTLSEWIEWRRRLFEEARPVREEALRWLPDTEQGRSAPSSISSLAKHERIRGAGYRALQGLAFDPLDDELAWIAGHASDFLYGLPESRAWFDRFLALHGIRAHDHRTYAKRTLDAREREALDVVQRSVLPQPPPRGSR